MTSSSSMTLMTFMTPEHLRHLSGSTFPDQVILVLLFPIATGHIRVMTVVPNSLFSFVGDTCPPRPSPILYRCLLIPLTLSFHQIRGYIRQGRRVGTHGGQPFKRVKGFLFFSEFRLR
jgi:hypothetical protein